MGFSVIVSSENTKAAVVTHVWFAGLAIKCGPHALSNIQILAPGCGQVWGHPTH